MSGFQLESLFNVQQLIWVNTSKALYFRKNAGVLKQLLFEEKDGKKKF